jgi:MYXO-CTERM domain-containing protein
MVDLGTLGSPTGQAQANGINNRGEVVGVSNGRAFATDVAGVMRDLGTLGGTGGAAADINDSGRIVGLADLRGDAGFHAFRTGPDGVMRDLGTLGGTLSHATGINNAGQVVGQSDTRGNAAFRAFRTDAAGVMRDLGTLGGTNSGASAINESGQVVGGSAILGDRASHAFRTDAAGVMHDLGTLGGSASRANGINDTGWVVGLSQNRDGSYHAFVYDSLRGMRDLNDLVPASSGWTLAEAVDVNNLGQIVGRGTAPNGETLAFLLTPVPEPSLVGLLGLCGLSLLRRRRVTRL